MVNQDRCLDPRNIDDYAAYEKRQPDPPQKNRDPVTTPCRRGSARRARHLNTLTGISGGAGIDTADRMRHML